MIPKKFLDSVLDKSIILTITALNDNAKSISVQCEGVEGSTIKQKKVPSGFKGFGHLSFISQFSKR